ncbi:MAG TPA: ribosome assembly RNA-binding protein YhbY [Desulfobacteria bacterium]|nr:ribosome assembly RNA-binding protein YhbY [Desulfobacteria bacterium]
MTEEIQLTGKQKRFLRGLGSKLDPVLQIGKGGVLPGVVAQARDALEARELIKVRILSNCLEDRKEVARLLSERSGAALVQVLGRTFLLYHPSSQDPQIQLP